ncbi:MAG: hypothetical protein ACLPUO_06840 [Streptosporangiaceae bacterium]
MTRELEVHVVKVRFAEGEPLELAPARTTAPAMACSSRIPSRPLPWTATRTARRAWSVTTASAPRAAVSRMTSAPVAAIRSNCACPARALSSAGVPVATTRPASMNTTEPARASASSRYCVVSSTVVPRPTRPRMMSHRA